IKFFSIAGPLKIGAILAGADKILIQKLDKFGINLGIAYQIQDDILGIFGNEKSLGKSTYSDIEEGKTTLLYYYASKFATPKQKKVLDSIYGHKIKSDAEFKKIKEIFTDSKALQKSQQMVLDFTKKAKQSIPKQQLLLELADYLIERKS